jgi:CheY-like chemotaxis protein
LDVDEAALLMRAVRQAQQPRDIAVMTMLLHTGISLGELTELTLADLDLAPQGDGVGVVRWAGSPATAMWGCLRLHNRKSAQSQQAPLDQATWEALTTYLAVRPTSLHPYLFLTTSEKPLTLVVAWCLVKRYARAAGMPWVHSRSVRSGFVLRQLAAGIPLLEVQSQMGHRQITTTRRYAALLRSAAGASIAHRRTCGVLIVDERLSTRRQLRLILEDARYQVFEASDSVSACDMLCLSRLSLVVLLSLWAPFDDSAQLLLDLARDNLLFSDHRLILLVPSGDDRLPTYVNDIIAARAIPIITRPIDFDTLQTCIARTYAELDANGEARKNPMERG